MSTVTTNTGPSSTYRDDIRESVSTNAPAASSRRTAKEKWGIALTVYSVLFLGFDSISHLLNVGPVQEANAELGAPDGFAQTCGAILAVCLVTYLVPRVAPLGAVLLTGYLGGAVCLNLFTEQPAFNTFFAVLTGVLVWAGLWLRDDRVKVLHTR